QLGKVFAPVRYDMNGNIEKITNKYREDPVRFEFIGDLLATEQAQGGLRAADALLWLRRALHFFHEFLHSIVKDTKANSRREDLSENIQTAYKETLQKHHGFLAQRLFSVLSKMVPSRSKLLKTLALGSDVVEERVMSEVEKFLLSLNTNLIVLEKLYEDLRLNTV
ncbi:Glycolipid transfer protein, partial [Frankliniella fusca]